ncbi:serine hydrolase domain-containing protein [Streptomyces sp. NPDC058470]|uniref:serine hydrolase domain-containing protein n=1 Tax=Streptomyces sp. NPDC058470 TaxID=3346515 RepID=UPI00366A27E5
MRRRSLIAALGAAAAVPALTALPAYGREVTALQRGADAVHRAGGAVGVAAVLHTPSGVSVAHSGVSDLRTDAPVRPDARYRAGSTVKTLVATVLLQLVGEGRLSLDDAVEKWLPGVVGRPGITVRHLLQHTSGLRSYTSLRKVFPAGYSAREYYDNRFRRYTARELVTAAVREQPVFEPGAGWSYSNTNYVLAGMVIKQVTGRAWRTEVRDRIVRPLGLSGTTLPGNDPYLRAPYLHGYHTFAEDGRRIDTTVFNSTAADASGDLVTTPGEVNRVFTALVTGELLRPAQLTEMQRTRPMPDSPERGYGLGLETTPLSTGGFYWNHGGNALGFASENGITLDGRRSVTVVVNSFDEADEQAQEATDRAVKALIDRALTGVRVR